MGSEKPMRRISLKISGEDRQWLANAAEIAGKSLSDFMIHAAVKEAHRVLGPPKLVMPNGDRQ
jgi:uncharacterized protein (DUF1778 family)